MAYSFIQGCHLNLIADTVFVPLDILTMFFGFVIWLTFVLSCGAVKKVAK